MPDLQSNASTFRLRGGYHCEVWAGSIPQTVVLGGTLSATPTFPAEVLAYTTTSGSSANVKRDQRVVFYRAGIRIGETRVAFSGTISSTSLPIAETSANTINFTSGDTFTVIDEWRILDRLVSASSTFDKDSRIAYTDQLTNPAPVANAGGLWFGFLDVGQTYATVLFDMATSFTTDPDSGGTMTQTWDVSDGTITVGSTTTAQITVRFPAGFRHVTLTVVDSDNGKSTIRYIPVRVYDRTGTLPMRVTSLSLNGTVKEGWSAEIEISHSSAQDLSTLPDGSLIVLFEVAYLNGVQVSYRSNVAGRSHILASLFLESDSIAIEPGVSTVSFRAESPLAVLARTPALPQLMIEGSTADWSHIKELTVNRALLYIVYWHSTVMQIFDFLWVSGTDLHYQRLAVENIDTIGGQLTDVASAINVDVTCDALGRILLIRNPNYQSIADRAALVTTYALTVADMMLLDIDRDHHGSVKSVRGEGINGANHPMFSNAGDAPSPLGTGTETLARQITPTQADLNRRTGLHFAYLNNLYYGQFVPSRLEVTLPDAYGFLEPAYREWVTIALAAGTNDRGLAFAATERWTVESVNVNYDADTGGKDVTAELKHETFAADGVSYFPPPDNTGLDDLPSFDDFNPTPVVSLSPFDLLTLSAGTQSVFAVNSDGNLYRCGPILTGKGFDIPSLNGGPQWANTASGITTPQDAAVDPFSYATASIDGYVSAPAGVYKLTDCAGPVVGIAASHAFGHTVTGVSAIDTSIASPGWVMAVYFSISLGTYCAYSTDGGATWNGGGADVLITNGRNTDTNIGQAAALYMSIHTAGVAYAVVFASGSVATNTTTLIYRTADYGATWADYSGTLATVASTAQPGTLHFPWHDNANELLAYQGKKVVGTGLNNLFKINGGSASDITPTDGSGLFGVRSRRAIASCTKNQNVMVASGKDFASAIWGMFVSPDGGGSWTLLETPTDYGHVHIPDDPNVLYVWGDNGAIGVASAYGTVPDSRKGNITVDFPSIGTFVNIWGLP